MVRKILSLLLIFIMVFSFTAYAEEGYGAVEGTVLEVQKYGNLTMDTKPQALYDAGYELGDILRVAFGDQVLQIPFCTSYSDVDTGSLVVRHDKANDLLVVAINMGNFSTTYNVNVGDKLTFSMHEKGGYLGEYLMRQLTRTNVREDYESDEVFANFRLIKTTGITPGLLYRSSSPVNNELGRAAYADKLAQAAGVKTIINFADSDEEVAGYMAAEDYNSPYYKSLYDSGKVINLNMGVDIAGADFGEKLAQGLRFLINNEGPYLIHCTEGKDRAGFASALLECLMGASLDEVVADYMTTYENYYKIEKGSEQYNKIAESNIIASVTTVLCGLEKGSDISECDLALAAENYLLKAGMTSNEIAALKSKLSAEITVPDLPPVEEPVTEEPVVEETPVSEVTYVVVAGDCLWNIAKTYLGNGARYMEIYNLNKDKISNPDLIYVGQILILPSE